MSKDTLLEIKDRYLKQIKQLQNVEPVSAGCKPRTTLKGFSQYSHNIKIKSNEEK